MINLKNKGPKIKHREKYVYFLRICNANLLSEMLHVSVKRLTSSEVERPHNSTKVKKWMLSMATVKDWNIWRLKYADDVLSSHCLSHTHTHRRHRLHVQVKLTWQGLRLSKSTDAKYR